MIFKELFSSSSPNKIYGDALEKCRSHPEVGFWTSVISLCFCSSQNFIQGISQATWTPRRALAVLPVLLAGMGWVSSRAEPSLGQVSTGIELVWTSLLEAKRVCTAQKLMEIQFALQTVLVSPYWKSSGLTWVPAKCSTWIQWVCQRTKFCRSNLQSFLSMLTLLWHFTVVLSFCEALHWYPGI